MKNHSKVVKCSHYSRLLKCVKCFARTRSYQVPERCIEHCNLFIPNRDQNVFGRNWEFEKEKLVQMWIAEECVESECGVSSENLGNLYFDALVQDGVIVPARFLTYKLDDSWWTSEGRGQYLTMDVNSHFRGGKYLVINARARARDTDLDLGEILHLTLTWECESFDQTSLDAMSKFKQLHTLVLRYFGASTTSLPDAIFSGLRCLKALDMRHTSIKEVPSSIGQLESLRFLDISQTFTIKRLPESLDRLCFLQVLNLDSCSELVALPTGLRKLVNLLHLNLDIVRQLKSMPRGMGDLVKLQTLQGMIVGKDDGWRIGELKNMNNIRGSFCISNLENVSDAEEAKEAALWDKKYIDKLELTWGSKDDDSQDTTEILESLQPHFDLKELEIKYYRGSKLPSWISNLAYSSLSSMTLFRCKNCNMLPSLGALPALKSLHIESMPNVRNIDNTRNRNRNVHEPNALFPSLETLTLEDMPNLQKWTGVEDGDFPRLARLSIGACLKLRLLPPRSRLRSLEYLEITDCTKLSYLPRGFLPASLQTLFIDDCPRLRATLQLAGWITTCFSWNPIQISSARDVWIDGELLSLR